MHKFVPIACLLCATASAQVFDYDVNLQAGFNNNPHAQANLAGQLTRDTVSGSVQVSGTFTSEAFEHQGSLSRQVVDTGQTYNQTLNFTFSVPSVSDSFDSSPVVPTHLEGPFYRAFYDDIIVSTPVGVAYTMIENGAQVGSGSGSFTVSGGPHRLVFNYSQLPGNLFVQIPTFQLQVSDVDIDPILFPHGPALTPPTGAITVPEPHEWTAIAGLGLAGLAVYRRFRA